MRGTVVDHDPPARDADAIDGGDLAVGIGQRVDQQAQRRRHLLDEQRARLWLRRRARILRRPALGRRRKQQIARRAFLDELVGERRRQGDGFIGAGRNRLRDRAVRQEGEAHFDVEDFEPLRHHAAADQRQQRDRHFRAGGGENRAS